VGAYFGTVGVAESDGEGSSSDVYVTDEGPRTLVSVARYFRKTQLKRALYHEEVFRKSTMDLMNPDPAAAARRR
jgi:hypothetical protein